MSAISLFASGFLFALGLALGGMTDANKVIGFLDVSGGWDPSLAMVMVGAIAVHAVANRWILARPRPAFAPRFVLPTHQEITGRLVLGASLFGAGWGLGGYCPGPGLVSVAGGAVTPWVFVATMSAGWWLAGAVEDAALRSARGDEPELERSAGLS